MGTDDAPGAEALEALRDQLRRLGNQTDNSEDRLRWADYATNRAHYVLGRRADRPRRPDHPRDEGDDAPLSP